MPVVLKDNTLVVLRRVQGNATSAMDAVAEIAEEAVQEKMLWGYHDPHGPDGHTAILDTGRLFDSITGDARRVANNLYQATVTTDVEYAGYVHNGTSRLKGRPYITDGLTAAKPKIEKTIREEIRKALSGNLPIR